MKCKRLLLSLVAVLFFIILINTTLITQAHAEDYFLDKTGGTISYAAGYDDEIQAGIAWRSPRFTDNYNGTIRNNLTGLIWLKDAISLEKHPCNNANAVPKEI